MNHRVEESDIRVLTSLDQLSVYQWNTMVAKDYFCPVCGIQPFRRSRTAPHMWTVNVRCLEGVDLAAIPVKLVYGSKQSVVPEPGKRDA